jgi:hypothetical protein
VARTPYLQALEFSTISAIETLVKFVSKKGQNPYQKKHLAMLTTPAVFIPTDNCAGGIFYRKPRVCASCRLAGDSILLFLENLDVLLHFLQKVSKRQSPQCMV